VAKLIVAATKTMVVDLQPNISALGVFTKSAAILIGMNIKDILIHISKIMTPKGAVKVSLISL
jgi:hypothetical protein